MSRYIKILGGGHDCRVVIVREIPAAVGEVDRRVHVADIDAERGLITCVWSRIGQMARHSTSRRRCAGCSFLVPLSGVDGAEGRVREHVGEEEFAGNGRDGTPKTDVTQR